MVQSGEVSLQSVSEDAQGFCSPDCGGKLIPPQNRQETWPRSADMQGARLPLVADQRFLVGALGLMISQDCPFSCPVGYLKRSPVTTVTRVLMQAEIVSQWRGMRRDVKWLSLRWM